MGQVCSAGQCGAARTCKRGVAYNFDNASVSADVPALKSVSWFYNWTAAISSQVSGAVVPAGVEFVPMVWGKNINVDTIANGIPAGAKYLLGFNEPNMGVPQSNLTPAQAAALWPQVEQIAQRKNLKIVSPAVNFCGSPCNVQDPVSWMDQFLAGVHELQSRSHRHSLVRVHRFGAQDVRGELQEVQQAALADRVCVR